ncbi:hypothetical protein, partial [Pseudoalteromonas sp. S16_S37]|uniref:hypothetical protein n=1 Tax=Pseudoalteromonas sp. S16_S37 TaxID=2720228 RepID=UPI0016802C2D
DLVAPNHELVKLANIIDWQRLEAEFGQLYSADTGALGKPRTGPQFSDMTLSDCSVFIVTKNIGTDDD